MIKRTLEKVLLNELSKNPKSILLLGPRQTGKSTLFHTLAANLYIDLSDETTFREHLKDPDLIGALIAPLPPNSVIAVDEIQRLPTILNTIQSIIDQTSRTTNKKRFLLTGSSARKLRRGNANLLPGRIFQHALFPLTYAEIRDANPEAWSLEKALIKGTLPEIYLNDYGDELLTNYINIYLREEVQAEALTRNLSGYARFLDVAAESSGQIINYSNLSSDTEIPKETLRRFYAVLCDTLLATRLSSFAEIKPGRKAVQKEMFIFFDMGVRNAVLRKHRNTFTDTELGKLFEQWLINQVIAFCGYHQKDWRYYFYRDDAKTEVDLVLDTGKQIVAIEIKYSTSFKPGFVEGLSKFASVSKKKVKQILVYRGAEPQRRDAVEVIPYQKFLSESLFELN